MNKENRCGLLWGKIYRLIAGILLVLAGQLASASGQTLTVLWRFGSLSNHLDGASPWARLIQGTDGNFYGESGGTNFLSGTVFRLTTGALTPLWQFGSLSNFADGYGPSDGLVQGSDGNFYGTTEIFGTHFRGTFFKITPAGALTPLWEFGSADGYMPNAVIQGRDGNFYGTTSDTDGTVFRISPAGNFSNLYTFGSAPTDGLGPRGRLVQGSDGNFYGVTQTGGTNNVGTVFKINSAGTLTTIWQFGSFPNNADGKWPSAGLVEGSDGNFYGTTVHGGNTQLNSSGVGTVFKISSTGTLTTLWQFGSLSNNVDSGGPVGELVQGSDGNFYGTTAYFLGRVFRITPAGALTVLWQFGSPTNNADGADPMAGLVQGSDGSFYGTTAFGGLNNSGTVFRLTVPLNPPANQVSGIQTAGSDHIVTVPSVAGETYQLQFTTDLTSGSWSNLDGVSVTNSIGALLTLTNSGGALQPQGFYRFDITP